MITRRLMLLSLALLGCRGEEGPLDPVWGKQPCEHCHMLVSQRASAAQLLVRGERLYFDDLGCLVQWLDEHRADGRAWVRFGDSWADAVAARYASGAETPMDHGYVAAVEGIDWAELKKRVLARAKQVSP